MLGVSLLVVALEVVGIVGLLHRGGVVVAVAAVGLLAWWAAGRIPRSPIETDAYSSSAAPGRYQRPALLLAVVAAAVLVAGWMAEVIYAYRNGMETVDTLWYHLPVAARFVQTGSVLDLHYLDPDAATVFYPSNSPLLHAFALATLREDVLSPVINLGWLALALTAAWAIGKPFRRAPHCLVAVALIATTPGFVATQPGGAYNDTMCLALGLAAIALLLRGRARLPASAVAGMAAALALGTKFTMIAPAGLLLAGAVLAAPKGTRIRTTAVWSAAFVALAALWYVRNAVEVGNPLPSLSLGPLAATDLNEETFTVAQYLDEGRIWRDIFIPGLRLSLGLAWWALLALAAAGATLAVVRCRNPAIRLAGVVAIVSGVAYLLTPQFLGLPDWPFFFPYNVRYAAVPLVLGLVLLPIVPVMRRAGAEVAWLAAAAAILLATQLDPGVWPTGLDFRPFDPPVRGAPALAGLTLGALTLALGAVAVLRPRQVADVWQRAPGRGRVLATAAVLAGGMVVWLAVAASYADRAYTDSAPFPATFRWAQPLENQRIGVVGIILKYPFYGRKASNHVQYLTDERPRGAVAVISTCRSWRRIVNAGRYDWLVLSPGFGVRTSAQEVEWTRSSPAADRVLIEPAPNGAPEGIAQVYRIRGRLDPEECPPGS